MLEIVGIVGCICFGICSLPQAIKIWKTHKTSDLSWMFLILWLIGEILTSYYVLISNIISNHFQYPLLLNYTLNGIILLYIIYAKIKYDRRIYD